MVNISIALIILIVLYFSNERAPQALEILVLGSIIIISMGFYVVAIMFSSLSEKIENKRDKFPPLEE